MSGDEQLAAVLAPMVNVVVLLTFGVPALGSVILLMIVATLPFRKNGAPRPRPPRPVSWGVLEEILQTDPAFTWEAFCARAITVYEVVQRARMVRQPEMARGLVTDELLSGLQNASAVRTPESPRSLVPIKVTGIGPVALRTQGSRRALTVRIIADTTGVRFDAISGGSRCDDAGRADSPVSVDELWTFERAITAHTAAPATVDGCPYCGAPVRDHHAPLCGYCGHAIRPATDDWHASRIEQTPQMMGVAS